MAQTSSDGEGSKEEQSEKLTAGLRRAARYGPGETQSTDSVDEDRPDDAESNSGEEQSEDLTAEQRKAARLGPGSVQSTNSSDADGDESDDSDRASEQSS